MTVNIAPFPAGAELTTQEFLDWLEAAIQVAVPDGFWVGHIGSDTPPDNSGPWLKDGKTLYVWDTASATYVPQDLGSNIGEIRMFATYAMDLVRYIPCDGSAIPRSAPYAQLFAILGTLYGTGDGSTTFNVPDLRGRVPLGAGEGSGMPNFTVSNRFGPLASTIAGDVIPGGLYEAIQFGIRYA
jgi:hypothetical protein